MAWAWCLTAACRASAPTPAAPTNGDAGPGPTMATPLPGPIARENALPGDTGWKLSRPAGALLAGFTSQSSARPGEAIAVKADSQGLALSWTLYRLGWYAGAGGRRLLAGDVVSNPAQPACLNDATTGEVRCPWTTSFTATLPADVPGGVFLFKLTRADGLETHVPLVVREAPGARARVLAIVAMNTWAAYDLWGGESLYADLNDGLPGARATTVSFERPYSQWQGAGDLWRGEAHLVRFLEGRGYDVAYAADADLDADPFLAQGRRLVLSSGHDEYASAAERAALEAALAKGVSLAFLGADSMYWKVRLEPGADGTARRRVVCFKDASRDPAPDKTGRWVATKPEAALVGVEYADWSAIDFPFVVAGVDGPAAWLWAGSGAHDGDALPRLVGYEADHRVASSPAGAVVVGASPFVGGDSGTLARHAATVTEVGSAFVFASGSNDFVLGLDEPGRADPRLQRALANVLARAGATPEDGSVTFGAVPPSTAIAAFASARVTTLAGLADADGAVDGVGGAARFTHPEGVALDGAGGLVVADSDGAAVRRVDLSTGAVTTLARGAPLQRPIGVAVAPDGTLAISDALAGVFSLGGDGVVRPLAAGSSLRILGVAVDAGGALFGADVYSQALWRLDPGWSAAPSLYAGTSDGNADGPGAMAAFRYPTGVALADDGTVLVVDSGNAAVRAVAADADHTVRTLAGGPEQGFADGATPAFTPYLGVAVDAAGAVYVADPGNLRVRRVAPDGSATTVAGSGSAGTADGDALSATFRLPCGLALDRAGAALYVSDAAASTIRVIHLQ